MEAALDNPALTVALALSAGMVANVVARHLKVPGIVLLLLTGVLLGPEVAGVVRPDTMGRALYYLVGMAVAVVLFEGGLNLTVHRLRSEAKPIRRLITVGALVTGVASAASAALLMQWPWEMVVPFGALLIVTGPTVVQPVLRRVPIRHHLATILEGEAVFVDAIGAIFAIVSLEFVLATGAAEAATDLLALPARFAVGLGLGVAGGLALGFMLRSDSLVPEGLENVLTLAFVLLLFEVSEGLMVETGILTAAIAGLVVGNMGTRVDRELKEFKEQLTVLMLALIFVLLAATVRFEDVVGLGWRGVATVAVITFLIRPLAVAVSTMGVDLEFRERAFLAWLAPRGVVAAAVAALFAQALADVGVPGAAEFQALVFVVIAVTVVVHGGLAGVVASGLGVLRGERRGYVIVGANPIGRTLAHALEQAGSEVVLIDTNAPECERARREGLDVVEGSAMEVTNLVDADLRGRRGLVAVTPNPTLNGEAVQLAKSEFGVEESAVALSRLYGGQQEARVHEIGAGMLFGEPIDVESWNHELREGTVDVSRWRFDGTTSGTVAGPGGEAWRDRRGTELLPLVVIREGRVAPVTDRMEFRAEDEVYFVWPYADGGRAGRWLSERGWEPAPDTSSRELEAGREG